MPSYTGTSTYLLLTKYNNYKEFGDGLNYTSITDPTQAMTDPITGVPVMNVVMEQLGPALDGAGPAVREWRINRAAIDPERKSAIVNSEDGANYKWDLASNKLTKMPLTTACRRPIRRPNRPAWHGLRHQRRDTIRDWAVDSPQQPVR